MKFQIQNKDSELFDIDDRFKINVSSYKRRARVSDRYAGDGGLILSDQKVDSRRIDFAFFIAKENHGENDASYYDEWNNLIGFLIPDYDPFYLIDTDNNRRTRIALEQADDDAGEGLEMIIGERNRITLQMLDGYWEDSISQSFSANLLSGQSLVVQNNGKFNAHTIIRLTPIGPNPEFVVRNTTTGAQFTITANTFNPGTLIEVNSVTGEITLDDGLTLTDQSFALADGSGLIQVLPGPNVLTYESVFGQVQMTVLFRPRYAF